MIAAINYKQMALATLIGLLLVFLIHENGAEIPSESQSALPEALALQPIEIRESWSAEQLSERLLAIAPKPPSQDEIAKQQAEAAKQAALAAEAAKAPPPVDKTLKPMFSRLDDEHQIGLLAIVQENQNKFAVLQVINFASRKANTLKLAAGEQYKHLTLSITSQTQVALSDTQGNNIILNLFKPRNT
ncbi:hypothetical protein [Planctobacterium marinum]|uniref:Uncharacterized protein n=1 Tax=Planctobacterium marinum TaxID=1631968 RepID=A0AA48HQA0_9ALTE|nr:hypothetical protein MACH26_32080 [Planctobacterium marinum]